MSESPSFLIARNPDPESSLPYLVRLPLGAGLVLKVRDTWPRTSRVFCARLDAGWPEGAELIEEVPVVLCRRRGVAVDLVLDPADPSLRRDRALLFGRVGRFTDAVAGLERYLEEAPDADDREEVTLARAIFGGRRN